MGDADLQDIGGTSGPGELSAASTAWWSVRFARCATDAVACGFFAELDVRGLSRNTLLAYGRAVEDLIAFAGPLESVSFNAQTVHGFIAYLRALRFRPRTRKPIESRPLSPATIRQRLVGLRAFADHLVDAGRLDRNPVTRGNMRRPGQSHATRGRRGLVLAPRRLPSLPDDAAWARLIEVLRTRQARDKLMFMLAYDGALRRSELVSLRLDDFDFSARFVAVRAENTKSGESRTVMYSEATGTVLAGYLAERRRLHVGGPSLFLSASARNRSQGVSGFTWGLVATALARDAKVPSFSTHTLRHLRLTDLARAGLDVAEIARFAGHRSTESTLLYIHLSGRDLARAFRRAAPRLVNRFDGL
ncbi:MAG TPA: site-specific integrase [Acetobacteraceae bacterium]|nr:site-specific integrase [Acetobacteraceae bacterium]